MSWLDERMESAISELRSGVDQLEVAPFEPRRSKAPAAMAAALLLVFVVVGLLVRTGGETSGAVSVATQPEATEDAQLVETHPVAGQLTGAKPGEFFVPLPASSAWNVDESRILLYRTGTGGPGHVVLDSATGQIVATLPFVPPDIEQVYWHPVDRNRLLYAQDASLMAYDLATMASSETVQFGECDRVDSGRLPSAPSADGTLGLLCHRGADTTLLAYNVVTGTETRSARANQGGHNAPVASPSGARLVVWQNDGSASVLDRNLDPTGVVLELDDNAFVFVTLPDGTEWIASTLFDGPAVGSIVLLPLAGGDPTTLIGPDRGDAYPPSGTRLSARGSKIAMTIQGADDGVLAGRLHLVDVAISNGLAPFIAEPLRPTLPHGSSGAHEYWSNPFVSLSPSGRYVVYSSDNGGSSVDAFVADLGN